MYDIFSLPEFKFPKGFLWGSATAGHQVEGDNVNSQYYHNEIINDYPEKSGKACNHYQLFREDVELIADLKHQAYRCSLEWSRIEPEEGRFNLEALNHYQELLGRLHAHGIKTFVTLCHWTWPQWFEEKGGLGKPENIPYFLKYVEKTVNFLQQEVDFWMILNEKTHTLSGEAYGFSHIRAHAQAYHLIKSICPTPVSSAHMALQSYPYRFYDELDNLMAHEADFKINGVFLHALRTGELISPHFDGEDCPEAKGAIDFFALNLYTRDLVDSRISHGRTVRFPHKKMRMINQEFYLDEMYPEGMTAMLERFRDYPVYITENGCSCDDDRFRIVYIALYLSAVHDAIKRGVDVRSYLYWSLFDNYEWASFKPRFGLVNVDFKTFKRTLKPSADFFRDIIEFNGLNQNIIRKYLKEMPSLVFPEK